MPVQAQLGAPRRVSAKLEEQRSEIGVVDIEVIVVDVDRLVPVELKLAIDLLPIESLRLLLCHPEEDDSTPPLPLPAKVVGNIVFPFLVLELVNRDLLSLGLSLHRLAELFRYLAQHHWRGNRLFRLDPTGHSQPPAGRRPPH